MSAANMFFAVFAARLLSEFMLELYRDFRDERRKAKEAAAYESLIRKVKDAMSYDRPQEGPRN